MRLLRESNLKAVLGSSRSSVSRELRSDARESWPRSSSYKFRPSHVGISGVMVHMTLSVGFLNVLCRKVGSGLLLHEIKVGTF